MHLSVFFIKINCFLRCIFPVLEFLDLLVLIFGDLRVEFLFLVSYYIKYVQFYLVCFISTIIECSGFLDC